MNHAPPPPPELDEKDQELQGKIVFMMAERSWRVSKARRHSIVFSWRMPAFFLHAPLTAQSSSPDATLQQEYSKSVSGIVDEMGDFLGADESILRSLMLKVEHETNGKRKAWNLVSIIKLLLEVKVSQLQHLCSPHSDNSSDLEENLEVMHKAVKAMYGWDVLVEDDYRKFRHMLDPECTMTQRSASLAPPTPPLMRHPYAPSNHEEHAPQTVFSKPRRTRMDAFLSSGADAAAAWASKCPSAQRVAMPTLTFLP